MPWSLPLFTGITWNMRPKANDIGCEVDRLMCRIQAARGEIAPWRKWPAAGSLFGMTAIDNLIIDRSSLHMRTLCHPPVFGKSLTTPKQLPHKILERETADEMIYMQPDM
jgi:hypothetical protein